MPPQSELVKTGFECRSTLLQTLSSLQGQRGLVWLPGSKSAALCLFLPRALRPFTQLYPFRLEDCTLFF